MPGLSLSRRWRSFREVGWRRRALMAEAAAWLLVARLALIVVPFPKLARRLGAFVPPADPRVAVARADAGPQAAPARPRRQLGGDSGRGLRAIRRRLPAPGHRRAGDAEARGVASALHFGFAKGETKPIDAHAWLDAAGVEVTGYPMARQFAEIACFV